MDDGRTPGAAADDGRVRRAVLEVRLGPSVRCPGGQPPGRHAVAALRDIRDGRARALPRPGRGRGRARLDLRRSRSASRSSTSASTTSSTSRPGSRSRRASGAARRRLDAARPAAVAARRRRSRRGRGHERPRRSAGARSTAGRRARRADHDEADDEHGLRVHAPQPARRSAASCSPSLAALYFLLPQLAGLAGHLAPDRGRQPVLDGARAACSRVGMFGGYVTHVPRRLRAAPGGQRIGWRASYQITMAGLAASRLFAAGGAGGLVLHGLGAAALRACASARRRRQDDRLPDPHLPALRGRADRLRPRAAARDLPGRGAVRPDRRAGDLRAGRDRARAVDRARAARPRSAASSGFAAASGRFGRLLQRLANLPAAASAGHPRRARARARRATPRCSARSSFWAFQIARAVGGVPARSASAPPLAVLIQAFFVGMLGNLLPMPGGVGGVEGGMIGALRRLRRRRRPRRRGRARVPRLHVLAAADPGRDRLLPAAQDGRALARSGTLYKVK